MRILLIEDDHNLTDVLTLGLEDEGFYVDVCAVGSEALDIALQNIHDIILLDRMLPGISGEQILRQIRQHNIRIPVIFITALGDPSEKIMGLDLGADDYLVKPFDFGELMARIRSVIRRTTQTIDSETLAMGDMTLYIEDNKLVSKGNDHLLMKKETELLAYFLRNPQKTLSRQQIIGNVWGLDADIEDGNLDNYIYLLRKKLRAINTNVKIITIHRQGYRISDE
ncbi:MAG: response regulator transcription factor [Lachnospiraceae bacterium]